MVALVLEQIYGGELMSAVVDRKSHWYNRIDGREVDLTGDQFGKPPIQISLKGETLYPDSRVRSLADVSRETQERLRLFQRKLDGNR